MIYTYSKNGCTRLATFDNDEQAREFLKKHPTVGSLLRIKTDEEMEKRFLQPEEKSQSIA